MAPLIAEPRTRNGGPGAPRTTKPAVPPKEDSHCAHPYPHFWPQRANQQRLSDQGKSDTILEKLLLPFSMCSARRTQDSIAVKTRRYTCLFSRAPKRRKPTGAPSRDSRWLLRGEHGQGDSRRVGLKLATAARTALRACVDTSYTHVKGSASSFQGAGGRAQARQGANDKRQKKSSS